MQRFLQSIQYHTRKLCLRHERVILSTSVRIEDLHMVCRNAEARILLRDIVRHDKVEVFLREFPACVFRDVLCLCRKANENLVLLLLPQFIEDIGVAYERQRQLAVRLLDLMLCRLCGAVVCDRRRLDDRIHRVIFRAYRCVHIACTSHIHTPHPHRC